jgi:hypothetical protein
MVTKEESLQEIIESLVTQACNALEKRALEMAGFAA